MSFRVIPTTVLVVAMHGFALGQLPPPPEGASGASAGPKLFVPQRQIDIGTVVEGDKATISWTLQNRGGADLVIDRAKSGCGCTVVELAEKQKTIPPGGTLTLKAEFSSKGRRGTQRKKVMIFSNDPSEPKLDLSFKAQVKWLYQVHPSSSLINLRSLQRGKTANTTLDITSETGEPPVEVIAVEVLDDAPMTCRVEPFVDKRKDLTGLRVFFTMTNDVPMGTLTAGVLVKLKVGEILRERRLTIRATIVGDLVFRPVVVDLTKRTSRRGQRLAPVSVRSPNDIAFDIFQVDAGPLFDVQVEPASGAKEGSEYSIRLIIREDAPFGPFATMLNIYTSSVDQPLLRIPVFGIVADLVKVEPPMVLLRGDGTRVGARRLVKLQAPAQVNLEILDLSCDDAAVAVVINREYSVHHQHLRYLEVSLEGNPPAGRSEAMLTVTTNVKDAERIQIPVTVIVPDS